MTNEEMDQVKQFMQEMEQRFEATLETKLDEMEARFSEKLEDLETSLLTEYHTYAEGVSAHFLKLDVGDASTAKRLAALESRVLNLETKGRR